MPPFDSIFALNDKWEFLIAILTMLGYAAANWFKNRGAGTLIDQLDDGHENPAPAPSQPQPQPQTQSRTGAPGQPVPPSRPAPTSKPFDWEAELRKMLEPPEPPKPQPAHDPRIPTIVVRSKPTPVITPVLVEEGTHVESHLAKLEQSARAHERASQLDRHVEEHMRKVEPGAAAQRAQATVARRPDSGSRPDLVRMLRQPGSMRQAMVLSEVFGKPKGLAAGSIG